MAQQCRENIYSIETLKDFQHIEDNRDQGMNVREKAKQMVILLYDDERLKNERTKFMMTRKKFMSSSGISSDGSVRHMRKSDTGPAFGRLSFNASMIELNFSFGSCTTTVMW